MYTCNYVHVQYECECTIHSTCVHTICVHVHVHVYKYNAHMYSQALYTCIQCMQSKYECTGTHI